MIEEVWKSVVGFEGYYTVSNLGKVKSLNYCNRDKEQLLRPCKASRTGHVHVCLMKNGIKYDLRVHQIVLRTFVGKEPEGMQCRHLNGIPTDNRLENLKWGTMEENQFDRVAHGTSTRGEGNGRSKLKSGDILKIKTLLKEGCLPQARIGKIFGISPTTIWKIKNNYSWKHVSCVTKGVA